MPLQEWPAEDLATTTRQQYRRVLLTAKSHIQTTIRLGVYVWACMHGLLVCRLKALLSQCPPRPEVFAAILGHIDQPAEGADALTLPAITKLLSKLNKRGQWRHGLALFWAIPSLGMKVRR